MLFCLMHIGMVVVIEIMTIKSNFTGYIQTTQKEFLMKIRNTLTAIFLAFSLMTFSPSAAEASMWSKVFTVCGVILSPIVFGVIDAYDKSSEESDDGERASE